MKIRFVAKAAAFGLLLTCSVPHIVVAQDAVADSGLNRSSQSTQRPDDDLRVLPAELDGAPAQQSYYRHLKRIAEEAINHRSRTYEALETPTQIAAYQKRRRKFFIKQLGGFPERTPLNPKIVGTIDGDGYRIEKLIFESRPEHFVPAMLYLPKSEPPYPGVIVPCGHSADGKTAYQHICVILARSGIAALCYDSIGQGERYQVLDDDGKPQFKSTTEHTLVGVGSILVGRNTATYRVWDGMRALDYLESRKEIDAGRLGCTGNSGGGTLTEYLMALDHRIKAAAPSCCVTTFARRLETIGPGDAEQNILGQIEFGLDHADYTIMRAPKPTLLCTATHDFVDIEGSWDVFRETKRLYTRMGHSERVDLVEADAKHGFSQPIRVAVARWMRRWLLEKDDAVEDAPFKALSDKQLHATPHGQAQLIDGARSVMDLNMDVVRKHEPARRELWKPENREKALTRVRELAYIPRLSELIVPPVQSHGRIDREGYHVDKFAFAVENGLLIPALLFEPDDKSGRRVVYLQEAGKHADVAPGGAIEQMVKDGAVVLAVDVRGSGEIGVAGGGLWGGDWDQFFLSYLLGRPLLGGRTEDVLTTSRWLAEYGVKGEPARGKIIANGELRPRGGVNSLEYQQVELVANGTLQPPALHAAALEPELFTKLTFQEPVGTWIDDVQNPAKQGQLVNAVHGALRAYDLPDLAEAAKQSDVKIHVKTR